MDDFSMLPKLADQRVTEADGVGTHARGPFVAYVVTSLEAELAADFIENVNCAAFRSWHIARIPKRQE
jgi:hypothetical protein